MKIVRKYLLLILFLVSALNIYAQNEKGPDGYKLIWALVIIVVLFVILFVFGKTGDLKKSFLSTQKVNISLNKDKKYYPETLNLTVKNTGKSEIDMDKPLLIFDKFWLKRKFRLKGTRNYTFYPLYMVKGYTHTLDIDLNHFYSYDKKLKGYPKVKISIFNVKGKRLGSKSIYLRKTLIKF